MQYYFYEGISPLGHPWHSLSPLESQLFSIAETTVVLIFFTLSQTHLPFIFTYIQYHSMFFCTCLSLAHSFIYELHSCWDSNRATFVCESQVMKQIYLLY